MKTLGGRLWPLLAVGAAVGVVPLSGRSVAQQGPPSVFARPPTAGALRSTALIGATVMSSDGELVGAVDDLLLGKAGESTAVVVALSGSLGLGEKDVALPFSALSLLPRADAKAPISVGDGRYGGSSAERVRIDVTVRDLASAPAFISGESSNAAGRPSSNSGVPESVTKEPKSSTKSGGPG